MRSKLLQLAVAGLLTAVLLCLASAALGDNWADSETPSGVRQDPNDPGEADTVRVAAVEVVASASSSITFGVPVTMFNDQELDAGQYGFHYDSDDVSIDSVSWIGSSAGHLQQVSTIDNAAHTVLTTFFAFFPPGLQPGDSLLLTIWFTLAPGAPGQTITIDSTFVPPAADFISVLPGGDQFVPQFIAGEITVSSPAIVINEILAVPNGAAGAGFVDHEHEWVEIFNSGSSSVDLSGWTISNSDGSADITLPSWYLPAGCYLTLHQAIGTDDGDFDDLDGHYYTGDTNYIFDDYEDECALYNGVPGAATIADFMAWSSKGSYTPGIAHGYAVSVGIWTALDYLDTQGMNGGDCFSRYFDGLDRELSDDWRVTPWYLYALNWPLQPENPIQEDPGNMSVIDDNTPTFNWSDFPDADSYDLQVDNDPDFSSPIINISGLTASEYTSPTSLPDDAYFHRVRCTVDGSPTLWAAPWLVVIETAAPKADCCGERSCPHKWQRKDTELLCLTYCRWNFGPDHQARPGCPETGDHRWNAPHPDNSPEVSGCPHCDNYCVRASIAMMNDKYGGDLSQDRISYYLNNEWRDFVAGPEGDLGHDVGCYRPQDATQEADGLSWALNGAAITVQANPTFDQIKGWVDQLDCFMARIPGHMMVIDNYIDYSTPAGDDIEIVYTQDPWEGPAYRHVYRFVHSSGATEPWWTRRWERTTFAHAFIQPTSGVTARMQEATVTTDSDNDGIMDFDEGRPGYPPDRPRRLHCKFNEVDSDSDEVMDLPEVRDYTFHDQTGYHPGHENDALTFPDVDGDGMRAEGDCDSDNDGDFDGGEDIDGNGFNPVTTVGNACTRETCQFDAADACIFVHTDKDVYLLGEPVYLVDEHFTRETHTYHADTVYHYEWGGGCPDLDTGDVLSWDGTFRTDASGHAQRALVMFCWNPGQYHLVVDVLHDRTYWEPDNWDPMDCWFCDADDWFHGWHWGYDWPYHNPGYEWPLYPYPSICYTEAPLKPRELVRSKTLRLPQSDRLKPIEGTVVDPMPTTAKRGCEILSYWEGGPAYFWPLPGSVGEDSYAMRFTPPSPCTLSTVYISFFEGSSVVESPYGVNVTVWDDADGLPGTELASMDVPPEDIIWFPAWTTVDFSYMGIVLDGDFHIGYSIIYPETDIYATVSDDGTYGKLRGSYRLGGFWYSLTDPYGDFNFFMEAEVCYVEPIWPEVQIYVPWWWWCYQFPPPVESRYRIGIGVPSSIWLPGQIMFPVPPSFVSPTGECSGTVLQEFERDLVVEDSLNELYGNDDTYWVGFSTPDGWQLPDSLMTTRVVLAVEPDIKTEFSVDIRMGDTQYGWSPTFYDSLLIQVGEPEYVCGDADGSQGVDIDDVVYLISFIFSGGPPPVPYESGDADCSGTVDIDDVVYLINFIFSGGNAPCDLNGDGIPDC